MVKISVASEIFNTSHQMATLVFAIDGAIVKNL